MSPSKIYRHRIDKFESALGDEESKSNRMSTLRLTAFLVALVCGVVATLGNFSPAIVLFWFFLCFVALGVFIRFVLVHRQISARIERLQQLRDLNEFAIHRLQRNWSEFPVPVAPKEFAENNTALDLDLFGEASVFQLSCSHFTPQGRYTFAKWLVNPSEPDEILQRQESVAALSDNLDWRQDLSAIGMSLSNEKAVNSPRWITDSPWLDAHPILKKYIKWSPFVFLASVLCCFVSYLLFVPLLVLGFHGALNRKHRKKIDESLDSLQGIDWKLRQYSEAFFHLETSELTDGRLKELQQTIGEASSAMKQLDTLAGRAAIRGSMLHPLVVGILCWDLRAVADLETWTRRYGSRITGWFEALGEFEALSSLAGIHFDEPDWVFPEFKETGTIDAEDLGHPLVQREKRVGNSVELGRDGRVLLVTGSNMSGKSTLLRSIGVNVTLAQAGAPVCATAFSIPPISLATSLRVQDSLSDGVSFFMAELNRIKEVVLLAESERDSSRTVVFLLDEMLQGTNTAERREIAERIIAHLTESGAIGAVTTHDLAMAEMDVLSDNADLVHFRETFSRDSDGKPTMTFDYQLREGLATTTNALKILEVMEIPV